ncbi:hypothetical protein C8R43DRAFT_957881 [Mycena crocata]|nr:hypothetical protein C8R43DRAFT_957881 [Mycena crocata]
MWKRLENTLNRSTHLIRHVREIGINHPLSRETFSRICSFPFSHLETVRIGGLGFDLSQSTLANSLQRLLQLPTLTYVDVRCGYIDPSVFLRIWDGFSPSIKHLKLLISDWSHNPPPPLLDPPSRITLVSLRIEDVDPGLQDWLTHDKSPFDFSSLKALSFGKFHKTDVMCWPQFSQAFKNIEALEFTAELVATPFDLSSFPQLALVSVRAQRVDRAIPIILATLRTISSTNCVHKIAIISPFPFDDSSPEQYAALDALLTNLPLRQSTVVELDTCFEDHVQYKAAFPRLVSKNMLRLKDYA